MRGVVVFYEDRQSEASSEFGLHQLLISLLADSGGGGRPEYLRGVTGRPCKGRDHLLKMMANQARAESRGRGRWVVGLLDRDKIADALSVPVPQDAADGWIAEQLMAGAGSMPRQHIVLLHDNTESVLAAVGTCDPSVDPDQLRQAVDEKNLLMREVLLRRAAWSRQLRECVTRAVPSLLRLRDVVLQCLTDET
jgi:hypothetical protein